MSAGVLRNARSIAFRSPGGPAETRDPAGCGGIRRTGGSCAQANGLTLLLRPLFGPLFHERFLRGLFCLFSRIV